MFEHLKKAADKAFGGGEEIDRILAMPMTQLRMELKHAFQKKKFEAADFDAFLVKLKSIEDVGEQEALALGAITAREVDSALDIDLSSPAKQLLWAAVVTRMMNEGDAPVAQSVLWKQLQSTIAVHNEGIIVSRVISASLQNDDVTFDWGQPGSWFYFDLLKNHINLDLYFSLMMGFEHIRATQMHEIGHSELSKFFSPRMIELFGKINHVVDTRTDSGAPAPQEKKKMTMEEQKELALLVREWELRFALWHYVEDNCVDQFSVNMSAFSPQSFGPSRNYLCTAMKGLGEIVDGTADKLEISSDMPAQHRQAIEDKIKYISRPFDAAEIQKMKKGDISPQEAEKMFDEIKSAVLMAFYENNGLFKGTDKNWARIKIFADDIRQLVDVSQVPAAKGMDAFAYLMELAAGKNGIRNLQPKPSDRMLVHPPHRTVGESYRARVEETLAERTDVMEHIWSVYLKKFVDVLLKDYEKKVEDRLNQKQQQKQKDQKQQGQQGQGQGQGGQGQGQGEDQDQQDQKQDQKQDEKGQGQNGQGQGEEESQEQKDGASSGSGGEPMDMDEELEKAAAGTAETPEDKKKKEQGQGQGQDEDKTGDEAAASNDNNQKPGKGWEQDPNQATAPKNMGSTKNEDIIDDDLSEEQKKAMKEAGKENRGKPGQTMSSAAAGRGRGVDLAALAKGDWRDFHRRTTELAPVINQVAEAFKKIREEQRREIRQQSRAHDFMPPDGNFMRRLDMRKKFDTQRRRKTGAGVEINDFKSFHKDTLGTMESTIEVTIMIDGSGSMPMVNLGNGVTAMDAAILSSVIVYMAARQAGIDAFIVMWGDPQPLIIATPKSSLKEVGEKLEGLKRGTNSGTSLAPGLVSTVEAMANHRNENGVISGTSHMIVLSDGDIADSADAMQKLEAVAGNAKNLSIDVAVLRPPGDAKVTDMEKSFKSVIDKTGSRLVGILRGHDPNEIPRELSRLMLRRVKSFKVTAEPDQMKRARLKTLHRKMTGK